MMKRLIFKSGKGNAIVFILKQSRGVLGSSPDKLYLDRLGDWG